MGLSSAPWSRLVCCGFSLVEWGKSMEESYVSEPSMSHSTSAHIALAGNPSLVHTWQQARLRNVLAAMPSYMSITTKENKNGVWWTATVLATLTVIEPLL